jgi:hypothetical protein
MYGTPWHGEGCFALPQRAPLQRIFVLEHGHGNVITRLTRSQMVAELFARAFVPFHRHEYVDSALSFLERVADSVPCYRYSFEPDERAVRLERQNSRATSMISSPSLCLALAARLKSLPKPVFLIQKASRPSAASS